MGSLEYMQWELRAKKKRWEDWRAVLAVPWNGDRGWEGRTIGLHLPMTLRNFAVAVQEKQGLQSMKEVLFKALVIGLRELDSLPAVVPPEGPVKPRARNACERCGEPRDLEGSDDRLCALCIEEDSMLLPEPPPKPVTEPPPIMPTEVCPRCGGPFDPMWHAMFCWTSGADLSEKVCQRCVEPSVADPP
jgi:hypothetical protein